MVLPVTCTELQALFSLMELLIQKLPIDTKTAVSILLYKRYPCLIIIAKLGRGGMQAFHIEFLITVVIFICDLCLQAYVGWANGIFLVLNKSKYRYLIATGMLAILVYSLISKKFLVFLSCLFLLQTIDHVIYIFKKKR